MISPEPIARAQSRLRFVVGAVAALGVGALVAGVPVTLHAQVAEGMQKGAREGNKAAGPIGGVLGGAIGGVVGAVGGVVGAVTGGNKGSPQQQQPAAKQDAAKGNAKEAAKDASKDASKDAAKSDAGKSKNAKAAAKSAKQAAVLTQSGAPQLTAEQIVANSDAYVERIKKELNLSAEQEKNWGLLRERHALSRPQRRRPPQSAHYACQSRPAG
jgi:hypothetical protein